MHRRRTDYPDPEEIETLDELHRELLELLGGPIAMTTLEYDVRETHLPRSWLDRAYKRVKRLQGDDEHRPLPRDARQRLVAVLNRLDEDVERVLEADDPRLETEVVYRGLLELEREDAASIDDVGESGG